MLCKRDLEKTELFLNCNCIFTFRYFFNHYLFIFQGIKNTTSLLFHLFLDVKIQFQNTAIKDKPMKLQNKLLRVFILLLFINSNNLKLNAQECIDYPDIIGDACENCAPPGWGETNIGQTYVHIMVPVNGPLPSTNCTLFDVSGPSPSGGNVVILQGSQDYFTTIFTTISGLDTDVTYTFGMYWEEVTLNCTPNNNNGGPLHITIDGEVFEFTGATEWELAEACFTPTSSSVEVIISTPQVIPGHTIIIDGNPNCALLSPCCLLDLIVVTLQKD